jgi:hypothetical protein
MDWILTNEGSTLMTKAVTGENLVFTRAETGTGSSSAPAFLTQVIGKQQDLNIDVAHEGSDCKITCLLNNYQVEEGYILKQIGIYAKLADDEDDILAIIGQQIGEQIHPAAEGEAEYEWITLLKVSGTSSITVEGGAGSLALKKDLFAHTNRQDNPHNVTAKDLGLDKVENTSPSDQIPIFGEAENRENIENGDKSSVLWGKVKKWFADLKAAAFAGVVNNCTTTEPGSVLDARQGKVLQDEVDEINSNMGGNILTYNEGEDAYYIQHGADSAPKKLGDLQEKLTITIQTYLWIYGNRKESTNIILKISQIDGVYTADIVSAGNARLHHLPTGDVGFLAASALVD